MFPKLLHSLFAKISSPLLLLYLYVILYNINTFFQKNLINRILFVNCNKKR